MAAGICRRCSWSLVLPGLIVLARRLARRVASIVLIDVSNQVRTMMEPEFRLSKENRLNDPDYLVLNSAVSI